MTKSKKTAKMRQKFNLGIEPKITTLLDLDHCYAFGLWLYPTGLKKKFLEEGDPHDLFCPPWIRPWADLAEKQQHL